jgi:proteic killer suppression protein
VKLIQPFSILINHPLPPSLSKEGESKESPTFLLGRQAQRDCSLSKVVARASRPQYGAQASSLHYGPPASGRHLASAASKLFPSTDVEYRFTLGVNSSIDNYTKLPYYTCYLEKRHPRTDGSNAVRYKFKKNQIRELYTSRKGEEKYSTQVVNGFFKTVASIAGAKDERDLYALKSLHYEKLKGKREGERSLRLNDQFRLIVEVEEDAEGKYFVICDIEDYHR